ncbi:MAG: hypothetical protein Q9P90_06225 [candidate division KSB1 bacterium]|nr:hypothetical protein [candidate division KSB1 bacterium]
MNPSKPTLVFVYNADGGLFNQLTDLAHKLFSPKTYSCNLCALTHSAAGMRNEWKTFISELDLPLEFLHRKEWRRQYGERNDRLPAIYWRQNGQLHLCIGADAINACRSVEELKQLILQHTKAFQQDERG